MKLVKINDVRVGQIWTFNEGKTYDLVIDVRNIDPNLCDCLYEVNYIIYGDLEYKIGHKKEKSGNYFIDAEYCRKDEPASNDILEKFKDMNNLVGFLGITHKIEDGKLVEIPREEFEEDDIIEIDMKKYIIININDFTAWHLASDKLIQGRSLRVLDSEGHYDEYSFEIGKKNYKKIGTLGVNFEWTFSGYSKKI